MKIELVAIIILLAFMSFFMGQAYDRITYTLDLTLELLVTANIRLIDVDAKIDRVSAEHQKELTALKHQLIDIDSKLDSIEYAVGKIKSWNISQDGDIILLTEAIMGFKEVWDTLELQRFTATAYSPFDNVSGIENDGNPWSTSTGSVPDYGTFAVCPKTIPYHSKVTVIGEDFVEHGVALDTGSTMRKFGTWIDLFRDTYRQTLQFGKQDVFVLWQRP